MLSTYADWVNALDLFKKGDDAVLEKFESGSFALDAGTVQRFYLRVNEAYKERKQLWLDNFQRFFALHRLKTIDDFEIGLRHSKQNLIPLARFVDAKGLPVDLRATLRNDLVAFVQEVKNSIKDNISKSDNSREKTMSIVNSFGLPATLPSDPLKPKSNSQMTQVPSNGRKIIF